MKRVFNKQLKGPYYKKENRGELMSVRFIIGRSGVGKTRLILDEIKQTCDEFPQGDPIYVLIPDQMSFHMEYQLLKQSRYPSLMRVQGLSFNRFAYRILQETGGLSRYHLDEVGLAILLKKVMTEKKDELSLFPYYANKPGFINKISEMISEFKSYCVSPSQLFSCANRLEEGVNGSTQSLKKIQDLAILYENFEQVSLNKYLMSEDYYALLSEQIANSSTVAQSDFYVDGYHIFNKQEELILFQLMKYAKSVTIVLTHDLQSNRPVFDLPRRTFQRLQEGAIERGLSYEIVELSRQTPPRFSQSLALKHLEEHFLQTPVSPSNEKGVSFFAAANQRIEVEEVAKRIYHLVHEEGYTYSDIAIYTGDAAAYDELIAAIFPKFEIPVFLDDKESMIHHPLMMMLYHLFEVVLSHWRHEALFTVIKTGLLMNVEGFKRGQSFYEAYQTYQRQVDGLENYCLTRNLKKSDWVDDADWSYDRYQGLGRGYVKTDDDLEIERQINQLKKEIRTILVAFEKSLKKAKTYKDYAIAVFTFLEECQIPQKLALFEESAEELGDLQLYKRHAQVWNKLLSLFEQLVEIGQEEPVSLEDFVNIFKAGIEEMVYATVPPRLDQVAVGELRRARYQLVSDLKEPMQYGIKHAFVLGVNEGKIPKTLTESSLLSETEREALKSFGIELSPSLVQAQADEQFILYTVFTSPKLSLTLSYASSNDEGKEFLPSYVYGHLKAMFKASVEQQIGREWEEDVYAHLTTPSQTVAHLIAVLKQDGNQRAYYEPLLDYYKEKEPLIYQVIMNILNYQNEVVPLDEALTKQLYSEEIVASVSRLELFNQCEFAHYLRYGLRLKERPTYRLDLPHIGELYHEALKRISEMIKRENRSFSDLSVKECQTLSQLVADELSEQLLYKILRQSKRMMKLTERLTQVVYKTLLGLKYQGQHSLFKPLFFELPFDAHETSGIHLKSRELPHGFKLSLKGIIDRVDLAKNEAGDRAYLRIIDYKSSEKTLELDKVYYGLSLQLLTYLDIVVSNALQLIDLPAEVGGLLYFHVHRPFISHDVDDLLRQVDHEQKVEQLQYEKYKMSGYLPEDYEVVHLSDQRLGEQVKSDIVPVTLKKDGNFASRGNAVLANDSLQLLRQYTNQMIEDSAIKITKGNLQINPTKHGSQTACDYCQYRGICQFDLDFSGNDWRVLPKMKAEVALEAIKCRLEEGVDKDDE